MTDLVEKHKAGKLPPEYNDIVKPATQNGDVTANDVTENGDVTANEVTENGDVPEHAGDEEA